jgi:hypothetical protein
LHWLLYVQVRTGISVLLFLLFLLFGRMMSSPHQKNKQRLEILKYSYWEHFKHLKDISLILPLDHPRRIELEKSVNELQQLIFDLEKTKL